MARTLLAGGLDFDVEMWRYAKAMKEVAADPRLGHRHAPNTRASLMGADVAINSRGLRDREYPYEKPASTYRILMLGDSITFGWGVALDDTVSKRLERMLNAAGGGRRFEVINTGVGNYNTEMELAYYVDEGHRYNADLVILNYFINDAEPRPSRASNPLAQWSMAYVFIAGRLDTLARMALGRVDWAAYYLGLHAPDAPGWRIAKDSIVATKTLATAKGSRFLLANYPELRELKTYRFASVNQALETLAKDNGIPYIDLLDSVRGVDERTLWVTPPDPHPNANANDYFAKALHARLQTEFGLP